MNFALQHTDPSGARAGRLETAHGVIETPIFMPVGTAASVKAVWQRELVDEIGAQIILGNTYHLYLRPGMDVMEAAGGLHRFMHWDGPILTDSGGYQVFSLSARRKLTEEGARFQSHIDGSYHQFTPENVVDIQRSIGSDIMMVLDECPPGDATLDYARKSNELTIRWAKRCKDRFEATPSRYSHEQALFGIVQGVVYPEVRRESAKALMDIDFPGYAIGGLSVGEPAEQMYAMVDVVAPLLPPDRPRYLMGVGTPANLLENIERGIDMFDCVLPTRNGRNGMLFTTEGIINIKNRRWREDFSEVDPGLDVYASRHFTKSYLRHLFVSGEYLAAQIASVQNLAFYLWLMRGARAAILAGRYAAFKADILPRVSQRLS